MAGESPADIARKHENLWKERESENESAQRLEETILREKLLSNDIDLKDEMAYVNISDMNEREHMLGKLGEYRDKRLIAIGINFMEMLTKSRASSAVIHEMAPDETAFRHLTNSCFQNSNVYQMLKELSRGENTIIITGSNGSVLCTRGTEVYGNTQPNESLRYRFGSNITCDERHALFISEPQRFQLPLEYDDIVGIILKENCYFILHDKFENYERQYMNSFQHGGVSMEEIIVPIASCTPK